MLRKTIYALILAAIILFIFAMPACTIVKETGGGYRVGVTPETHQTISDAGDAATSTLGLLSAFFPALIPIAAAAGVGTVTWKKMKKTVTKNREPLKMLVKVLERIKNLNPEVWGEIKAGIVSENPDVFLRNTIEELKEELENTTEV